MRDDGRVGRSEETWRRHGRERWGWTDRRDERLEGWEGEADAAHEIERGRKGSGGDGDAHVHVRTPCTGVGGRDRSREVRQWTWTGVQLLQATHPCAWT